MNKKNQNNKDKTCKTPGCTNPVLARDWCISCYTKWWRTTAKGKLHDKRYNECKNKWYHVNKERISIERKKQRLENPDKIRKDCREYYHDHKDRIHYLNKKNYNPAKNREQGLRSRYGITSKQYTEMYDRQHGVCYICGKPQTTGRWKDHLHIDHDHVTGKIRALLCDRCNKLIGFAKENKSTLSSAISYLEKFEKEW